MNFRRIALCLIAVSIAVLTPIQALACACCSNGGEYYRGSGKIVDFQLEIMKQMRLGDQAFLFSTEAGYEEEAIGLSSPTDKYSLVGSLPGNAWKLTFRDGTKSGLLTLPMPLRMETFKADLQDGQTSDGGGPLLYKEWRLEGVVSGTGIFKPGMFGVTRYSLVLQGRGNGCDNAEDFKSWRLKVSGKKANYAFYGKMGKPV